MREAIFKGKRVKIVCPKILKFPNGCIRNVLIEFINGTQTITNLKCLKKPKNKSIDIFNKLLN